MIWVADKDFFANCESLVELKIEEMNYKEKFIIEIVTTYIFLLDFRIDSGFVPCDLNHLTELKVDSHENV